MNFLIWTNYHSLFNLIGRFFNLLDWFRDLNIFLFIWLLINNLISNAFIGDGRERWRAEICLFVLCHLLVRDNYWVEIRYIGNNRIFLLCKLLLLCLFWLLRNLLNKIRRTWTTFILFICLDHRLIRNRYQAGSRFRCYWLATHSRLKFFLLDNNLFLDLFYFLLFFLTFLYISLSLLRRNRWLGRWLFLKSEVFIL